jgi:hypothetical protein
MTGIFDVVIKNPGETVVVLGLGALLGYLIEKKHNKCECDQAWVKPSQEAVLSTGPAPTQFIQTTAIKKQGGAAARPTSR